MAAAGRDYGFSLAVLVVVLLICCSAAHDYYAEGIAGMSNRRATREEFFPEWVQSTEPKCVPVRPFEDNTWLLNSSFRILMMQTGFAVVESSFVRARNSANMYGQNARPALPRVSCACDI